MTYRAFHHTRHEQDRAHKLAQSQQVTESYAKAVEQLGHAEAPVRLGAMYALERLAQDNPSRRQTIVDVLCAYLRMPYAPPMPSKPWRTGRKPLLAWRGRQRPSVPRHDPAQELSSPDRPARPRRPPPPSPRQLA